MIDGPDAIIPEQSREDALQNLAVGQHVGDAAGHAQIVFQHGEAAIGQANQIGSANAYIDVARDTQSAHFAAEVAATVDQFAGNDAVGQDRPSL